MNAIMKKSILFLLATYAIVGASCQDDKTIDKLLKATQGVETPFIRFPNGVLDKKPVTEYPGIGIAVSTGSAWAMSIPDNHTNWDLAYSWGNPAGKFEPLIGNPTVNDYVLSSTTNGVRSWIPNGSGGSMVYPGPGIPSSTGSAWGTSITDNSPHWNTAYDWINTNGATILGWGPHVGLYRPITWVPTWTDVLGKPSFALVATSGLFADLLSKPTTLAGYGITNAMSTSHPANVITSDNITNWSIAYSWVTTNGANAVTAYGWGPHAGLYRPITWIPTWTDILYKPTTFAPTPHTHDYNTDIVNKPPEKDLMAAIMARKYLEIPSWTTTEINSWVMPAGATGIVKDATLNVYKVYKDGVWSTVLTQL